MSSALPRFCLAAAALAATALLAGCTGSPSSSPTSARPSNPASSTAAALSCSDLADEGELDAALGGAAAAVDPVATLIGTGSDAVAATAVPAAGGLQCAWRGAPDSGFAPVLTAQLLPDPDARWTAMLFGDGPSTETRTYGEHTVTAASGDPGFGATARIAGVWVFLERTFDPQETAADPGDDRDLDAAFTSILDAVAARGAQLGAPRSASASPSPSASAGGSGGAGGAGRSCDDLVATSELSAVVGGPVAWVDQPEQPERLDIESSAMRSAGDLDCFANGAQQTLRIRLGHGRADAAGQLKPGFDTLGGVDFVPAKLAGLGRGDWAIRQDCGGSACSVAFAVGNDLYDVDFAHDPVAVANAVIAARR
ncbi:hypothetical protein FJ656_37035 [Schumannella luteola]|uniref:DUF3558 domain-containing protein n=1 Tax=Schumannella luteola TaxID=472059 RepID=A0A852YFH9_9MICO|nr:hypothetical protein [Schumannella luteola]NYG99911.1 hypothetical protein [Schumannella luteola]TPW90507.1 hypothetical protein FJ656_37035 [Schumannella luteola]